MVTVSLADMQNEPEDNQFSMNMTKNQQFHGRSKHIVIKYHFIQEQVKNGKVELKY